MWFEKISAEQLASLHDEERRVRRHAVGLVIGSIVAIYAVLYSTTNYPPRSSTKSEVIFDRRLKGIFHHNPGGGGGGGGGGGPTIGTAKSGQNAPVTSETQTSNLYPQSGDRTKQGNVCGAIQAVLGHPTNPDICFAGSVNGGVWRTYDCMADFPNWKPLTDRELSNSIADLKFDENDANKLLVAIGRRSSFSNLGGRGVGLLLTANALADTPTWTTLSNTAGSINFAENNIEFSKVLMRGDLIMAAAFCSDTNDCNHMGTWHLMDGGKTFTNILMGAIFVIAADPNNEG